VSSGTRNIDIMNFRVLVAVMGCSLMMLTIPVSQSTGGCPFVWSYRIPLLSAFAELVPVTFNDRQIVVSDEQVAVVKISGCALDLLVHSPNRIMLYSLKYEKKKPLSFDKREPARIS
jgi:hypothetical protein